MKLTREAVMGALKYCDGHTLWNRGSDLDKVGLPKEFLDNITVTHKSDFSDPKSTIFDEHGMAIKELTGVYGKTLAEAICRELKIDTFTSKLGRGSHVSVLRARILQHFKAEDA